LVRKYFSDGNNYLGFKGGFGFSPDEARIQSGAGLSVDGIYVLKSQHIGITWQKSFSNNFTLNANYTLTHQELSFELGEYVWVNGVYIALRRKF
jgi:YaiO family outer membrane protein